MDLDRELSLAHPVCVLYPPDGLRGDTREPDRAAAVVAFTPMEHDLEHDGPAVMQAAMDGRPAWLAVPDPRHRRTDLTSQIVDETLVRKGLVVTKQVRIGDGWTALRLGTR